MCNVTMIGNSSYNIGESSRPRILWSLPPGRLASTKLACHVSRVPFSGINNCVTYSYIFCRITNICFLG